MSAADTAWRRPLRPPRPRIRAASFFLTCYTIFLATLQLTASSMTYKQLDHHSSNKAMVSTHPCPSKPELYLRPNNTNASILLCARTLPEHFPTSLLDLSSHALHENSFTIMPTAQRNQRTFTHKHSQYFQLPCRPALRLNRTPLVAYASHTTLLQASLSSSVNISASTSARMHSTTGRSDTGYTMKIPTRTRSRNDPFAIFPKAKATSATSANSDYQKNDTGRAKNTTRNRTSDKANRLGALLEQWKPQTVAARAAA